MCGRFGLRFTGTEIADELAAEWTGEPLRAPRYNVAPTQYAPVLRQTGDGPRLEMLRWGLIPAWSRDPSVGNQLINARAETAAQKPSFRSAFKARRALVPISGFWEWQKTPSGKVPHWIYSPLGASLLAAGLWEEWRPEDAEPVRSFTILTTTPSDFMGRLHHRMPVLLDASAAARWLDPATPAEEASALLRPAPEDWLAAYPVSTRVNSPRNEGPELLEPLEGAQVEPLLFDRDPAAEPDRPTARALPHDGQSGRAP